MCTFFSTICRYQPTAYVAQCVLTYLIHSLQIVHSPQTKKKQEEEQRKILPTTHSLTHKTQTLSLPLERAHNWWDVPSFVSFLPQDGDFFSYYDEELDDAVTLEIMAQVRSSGQQNKKVVVFLPSLLFGSTRYRLTVLLGDPLETQWGWLFLVSRRSNARNCQLDRNWILSTFNTIHIILHTVDELEFETFARKHC